MISVKNELVYFESNARHDVIMHWRKRGKREKGEEVGGVSSPVKWRSGKAEALPTPRGDGEAKDRSTWDLNYRIVPASDFLHIVSFLTLSVIVLFSFVLLYVSFVGISFAGRRDPSEKRRKRLAFLDGMR